MTSAQLSLFDVAKTVATSYQVGNRVKLRKKPFAASYVKKGDIIEIAAIHPIDGSIKFWNDRSERYEFVYPDEIGSIVESVSLDDSVTLAEVAVTESFAPKSGVDSPTPAEVAVGESNNPPDRLDSPTPAEVAVGESNCSSDDDCLALKAISTYQPRGTARSGIYFRLSYKDGGKVRTVHIRGGNTDSPIAQAKVREVRSLLASGMSPAEVATFLKETPNL